MEIKKKKDEYLRNTYRVFAPAHGRKREKLMLKFSYKKKHTLANL